MSKLEVAVLIDEAVEHTLKTQKELLEHTEAANLMPIIRRLNGFATELEKWRTGKFYLKDMSERFVKEATQIEREADRFSVELWTYAPVPLVAICREIQRVTRQAKEDKTFTKRLKDHYNNVRIRLLEQVAGARLLENFGDLGEEVERIFAQYLARALGTGVRVLRGGHIYDYADNRSKHQIDIIITPNDALGYCPAGTEEGKYNVLIDQVLAAISVKTTLTPAELEKCWEEVQGIPEYTEKTKAYPNMANETWPLCFIVAAYTESLKTLQEKWDELRAKESRHIPQMVLVLDSGYMIPNDASWPYRIFKEARPDVRVTSGLAAGLGLGWLNAGIIGRKACLEGRSLKWVGDQVMKLFQNEATRGIPSTYDPRFDGWFSFLPPIQGVIRWGWHGVPVHNHLQLSTVVANDVELTDPSRPVEKGGWQQLPFAYRLFRVRLVSLKGKFCAFEEWIEPKDKEKHRKRIAVFDSATGQEVFDPRFDKFTSALELQELDLSDLQAPTLGENAG